MSVMTAPAVGTFCWPELCTSDASASRKFYGSLFGWDSGEVHMPEGDYTTFKFEGQNVGAMYQMKKERKKAGIKPHWNSYIAVEKAGEICQKAATFGGKVLMPPFDVEGDLMANLQDPTGAKFSIWEARGQSEPTRLNDLRGLCWTDLYTSDTEKASAFYSTLFGWRPKEWEGGSYFLFELADRGEPICGMHKISKEMKGTKGMQPQWMPYFQVENADEMCERVRELGGKVYGPLDIPSIGRMAMLTDPQGARFAIMRRTSH